MMTPANKIMKQTRVVQKAQIEQLLKSVSEEIEKASLEGKTYVSVKQSWESHEVTTAIRKAFQYLGYTVGSHFLGDGSNQLYLRFKWANPK